MALLLSKIDEIIMNSCPHCDKSYTNKSSLIKHQLLCEFLSKSKRSQQVESEETTNLPTYAELVRIVQDLAYKNALLEKKVEEQLRYAPTITKTNILDWLQANITPDSTFEKADALIDVREKHIQYLMEFKMIPTLSQIFQDSIDSQTFPLFHAKNIFYGYFRNELPNPWRELTKQDWVQFLNKIHQKVLRELCNWRAKNLDRLNSNDQLSILYNKTMIKLMDIEFNHECTLSKVRLVMQDRLKN